MSLLVVHIGAGKHSQSLDSQYKRTIRRSLLATNPDGMIAIHNCSKILDGYSRINSGYGSCLNIVGEPTNDVSFVQYTNDKVVKYFSCHNVVHNFPLQESIKLYNNIQLLYQRDLGKLGLVRPNVIDYDCRSQVEARLGLEGPEGDLAPEVAIPTRQRELFDLFQRGFLTDVEDTEIEEEAEDIEVQDTIGMIHRNTQTQTTTIAASSGGNFLKLPGRIGCAGIIGAGLGYRFTNTEDINCMCSGTGEDLIMLNMANYIINNWIQGHMDIENFHHIIKLEADKYLLNTSKDTIYMGAILTIHDKNTRQTRLIYYHTTETFYFGYNNNGDIKIVQSKIGSTNYVIGEYMIK